MSNIEIANKLQVLAKDKDIKIERLLTTIEEQLQVLEETRSTKEKYNTLVETEYLFVRVRTLVEFEHIRVKKMVNSDDLMPYVKAFFVKRDMLLAQISQKLTTIQNDISIISKLVYQQTFNK